jgi:hypothetical protein
MTDYNVIPVEKPRTNGYVAFQELTRFHRMVDLELYLGAFAGVAKIIG